MAFIDDPRYTKPGQPGTIGTGPAVGGSTVPGSTTPPGSSYTSILQNDPIYQQLLKDLSAQGIADEAGAKAQAQRAFINFGDTAGFDQPYGNWIDDPTRQLAQKNTEAGLSIQSRLSKANRDAIRSIRNALAARGALRSGELGYQLGEENLRFGQAQYDARQQLTDFLSGISTALAQAQRQRAREQAAGVSDAVGRAPTTPPPAAPPGKPPPSAPPPAPAGVPDLGLVPLPNQREGDVGQPDPWFPDRTGRYFI